MVTIENDPLRLYVVEKLVARLAKMDPSDVLLGKAAIWGQKGRGEPGDGFIGKSPEIETYPEPSTDAAAHSEQDMTISVTASLEQDLASIYSLSPDPASPFANVTFDVPASWSSSATELVKEQFVHDFISNECEQLREDTVRTALDEALEFRTGKVWRQARVALLTRLASLGPVDTAVEYAHKLWGATLPTESLVGLAPYCLESRGQTLTDVFEAARAVENRDERAQLMAPLITLLPRPEKEFAVGEIATIAQNIIDGASSQDRIELLPRFLSLLPSSQMLPLWEKALRLFASGTRKHLLAQLPRYLPLVAELDGVGFWTQTANAVVEVRRRWQ